MHVAMIDIINELVKNNKEQKEEIRLLKQQQLSGRVSGGGHPDDVDAHDADAHDGHYELELEAKLDVLMELDPRKSTILRSTKMKIPPSSPEKNATNRTSHKDSQKNNNRSQ